MNRVVAEIDRRVFEQLFDLMKKYPEIETMFIMRALVHRAEIELELEEFSEEAFNALYDLEVELQNAMITLVKWEDEHEI